MFDRLKVAIVGAAGIIALIPGAGLLIGELKLPAPFDELLGLMAAIVGPFVFFLVVLAGPWIERQKRAILIGAIAALGFGGLFAGYVTNEYAQARLGVYRYMNGSTEVVERYLIPESYSKELQELVDRDSGNLSNAINRDREATLRLLRRDALSVRRTVVLGFLLAQTMIIIAFVSAAWAVKTTRSPS